MPTNAPLNRKLRMGLIGGGQGAFIGRVHATAAVLDNRAALVAGALSSDPAKAKASAPDYDISAERAYGSYVELIEKEKALPADKRIDFVTVATPNHTHFPIAKAALEAGLNVICDKPMTIDLKQAEELQELVKRSGCVFAVTHNYTGYPLVRRARRNPGGAVELHPGLAAFASRIRRAEAGGVADRPRQVGRCRLLR